MAGEAEKLRVSDTHTRARYYFSGAVREGAVVGEQAGSGRLFQNLGGGSVDVRIRDWVFSWAALDAALCIMILSRCVGRKERGEAHGGHGESAEYTSIPHVRNAGQKVCC